MPEPTVANTNNRGHLGTLGSGNHSIEVCVDEANRVWFMLHSGMSTPPSLASALNTRSASAML